MRIARGESSNPPNPKFIVSTNQEREGSVQREHGYSVSRRTERKKTPAAKNDFCSMKGNNVQNLGLSLFTAKGDIGQFDSGRRTGICLGKERRATTPILKAELEIQAFSTHSIDCEFSSLEPGFSTPVKSVARKLNFGDDELSREIDVDRRRSKFLSPDSIISLPENTPYSSTPSIPPIPPHTHSPNSTLPTSHADNHSEEMIRRYWDGQNKRWLSHNDRDEDGKPLEDSDSEDPEATITSPVDSECVGPREDFMRDIYDSLQREGEFLGVKAVDYFGPDGFDNEEFLRECDEKHADSQGCERYFADQAEPSEPNSLEAFMRSEGYDPGEYYLNDHSEHDCQPACIVYDSDS